MYILVNGRPREGTSCGRFIVGGEISFRMRHAEQREFEPVAQICAAAFACLALANCSSSQFAGKVDPKYGVSSSPRVVQMGEPVPKGGGTYRVGKPYVVAGRTYVPEENAGYRKEGMASWYGDDFHGRLTANGEVFDMQSISAAHPTLPMPSYVRVTNLANKRSIVVRVNDRGPYAADRVIDLSARAAQLLDFQHRGVARVRVEYVGRAPLEGSDDRQLLATLRDGEAAPAPSAVRVASAKPFLPESFAPQTRQIEPRSLPLPPQRPYTLGQMVHHESVEREVPRGRDREGNSRVEATALPPVREAQAVAGTAAPLSVPAVSAFAPAGYDAPAAYLSGRGLY